MDRISFVAYLYITAIGSLFFGLVGIYEQYDYSFNFRHGLMTLAQKDPNEFNSIKDDELTVVSVIYETPSGNVLVPKKFVSGRDAKKMNSGTKIPLFFSKKDPERNYRDGEKPESKAILIIVGILAFFAARYAHKLIRQNYDNA